MKFNKHNEVPGVPPGIPLVEHDADPVPVGVLQRLEVPQCTQGVPLDLPQQPPQPSLHGAITILVSHKRKRGRTYRLKKFQGVGRDREILTSTMRNLRIRLARRYPSHSHLPQPGEGVHSFWNLGSQQNPRLTPEVEPQSDDRVSSKITQRDEVTCCKNKLNENTQDEVTHICTKGSSKVLSQDEVTLSVTHITSNLPSDDISTNILKHQRSVIEV